MKVKIDSLVYIRLKDNLFEIKRIVEAKEYEINVLAILLEESQSGG
ncbi:MAG: hypothetical protein ACC657_14900 [Thiohalomonadales bacterium]